MVYLYIARFFAVLHLSEHRYDKTIVWSWFTVMYASSGNITIIFIIKIQINLYIRSDNLLDRET